MPGLTSKASTVRSTYGRIVWVGSQSSCPKDLAVEAIISADDIKGAIDYADLFVIASHAEQDDLLVRLRQSEQTALSLILVTQASVLSRFLANGLFESDYHEKLEYYLKHLNLGKLYSEGNLEFKLLNYLWLHEGTSFEPMCVPSQNWQFHYPLLSLWGIPSHEHAAWFAGLAENR